MHKGWIITAKINALHLHYRTVALIRVSAPACVQESKVAPDGTAGRCHIEDLATAALPGQTTAATTELLEQERH